MTLTADEFIRRFLLHVLPAGFKRIRSYGWLSANRHRAAGLAICRRLLGVEPPSAASPVLAEDYRDRYQVLPGRSHGIALCAARVTWSASKLAWLESCHGLRLTAAVCTDLHRFQPPQACSRMRGRDHQSKTLCFMPNVALMNGIDPKAYPHRVIERIADHPANRIDELLPWNVAPLLPASARVNPIL